MRADPFLPQLPGGELLHVLRLDPLPVLAGLRQPPRPDAQVGMVVVAGARAVPPGVAEVRKELLAGLVEDFPVEHDGDPPSAPRTPVAGRAGNFGDWLLTQIDI